MQCTETQVVVVLFEYVVREGRIFYTGQEPRMYALICLAPGVDVYLLANRAYNQQLYILLTRAADPSILAAGSCSRSMASRKRRRNSAKLEFSLS